MHKSLVLALPLALSSLSSCNKDGETVFIDIEPRQGVVSSDQQVKIEGRHLRPDLGYTVYFGSKKASQVVVMGAETLVTVAPAREEPGPVDIIVIADNGEGYRLKQAFQYVEGAGAAAKRDKLAY